MCTVIAKHDNAMNTLLTPGSTHRVFVFLHIRELENSQNLPRTTELRSAGAIAKPPSCWPWRRAHRVRSDASGASSVTHAYTPNIRTCKPLMYIRLGPGKCSQSLPQGSLNLRRPPPPSPSFLWTHSLAPGPGGEDLCPPKFLPPAQLKNVLQLGGSCARNFAPSPLPPEETKAEQFVGPLHLRPGRGGRHEALTITTNNFADVRTPAS